MMRPRLEAARAVLAETGAIFVSIDDNEAAHLRLLMDEVFGERQLPRPDRGQPQRQGPPAGQRLRDVATSTSSSTPATRAGACSTRAAPTPSTPRDFPLTATDGRRYRHLPLRNTNKKFNPVTARDPALPGLGRPGDRPRCATDAVRRRAVEIEPVFGDGRPAVWRWSRAADRRSAPTTWSAGGSRAGAASGSTSSRRTGCTGRPVAGARSCAPSGWPRRSARPTPRSPSSRRSLGHVFESPKPTGPGPPDPRRPCRTTSVVLDFFAGSGTTGHAVALAERRRRRHPPLHQRQLRRADPRGLQRPQRRPRSRSPTSPARGSGRSLRRSAVGLEG